MIKQAAFVGGGKKVQQKQNHMSECVCAFMCQFKFFPCPLFNIASTICCFVFTEKQVKTFVCVSATSNENN